MLHDAPLCSITSVDPGSARRRAICCLIARSARCGSRVVAAYFVVVLGRKRVPSLLLSTAARDPRLSSEITCCPLRLREPFAIGSD